MAYGDFKGLPSRAAADCVLCDHLLLLKNLKCDGYQHRLASMV